MTPQELKNSILQLAIQGKLVEQRPEEGTAAELLEKIFAAKNAKDAKNNLTQRRREKATSAHSVSPCDKIPDDEKPFDIPESWEWVRLGEICTDVFSGKSPTYTKLETDYRIVGQAANQQEGLNLSQLKYTNADFWNKMDERYFLRENDVLLNTLGNGTLGRSGILGALPYPLLTDGHLFVFRTSSPTSSYYLYYYLQYKRHDIEKTANGSTNQTFLSLSKTVKWVIPLPPLAEQKRIVAKIEELLPLIDRYEKAWSKLENFNKCFPVDMQKSLLQMAIQGKLVEQRPEEGTGEELYRQIQAEKQRLVKSGKIKKEKPLPEITEDEIPFEIPESWRWVRLNEVCNVSDGTHQTPNYVEKGKPFISAQNIKPYRFLPEIHRNVSEKDFLEYNKNIAPAKGDILMTRVGAGIGEAAIINQDFEFSIYVSLALIKCYDKDFNMEYLLHVINSPLGKQLAKKKTLGKGASQGNLNLIFIREFVFPLPPLAEQKRIVAKLEEILPLCERLK